MNSVKNRLMRPIRQITFIYMLSLGISSVAVSADSPVLYPLRTNVPPRIDGRLDEAIWQGKSIAGEFLTYRPTYGEKLPYQTRVWIAYDDENIYFGYRCDDPEPEKIKSSITKRDNISNHDRAGFSLDALNNHQVAYDINVNPNGIQFDLLHSAISGADVANDFVFDSAGQITSTGYTLEIRLPLSSIRFKGGEEVKMGILFWRSFSRLGIGGSWPSIEPGHSIFTTHTTMVLRGLKSQRVLEILPNYTFGANQERETSSRWGPTDRNQDAGLSAKYGLSTSITADVTLNPDFSQIESDAFEVEVNQRFPIFRTEKRPFFMEGADIFSFFSVNNLSTPVHTRTIVDPRWAAKITGTHNATTFGILTAEDQLPASIAGTGSGRRAFSTIGRAKQSLGGDNYIGALYAGRERDGAFNRVAGMDAGFRLSQANVISLSFLGSFSKSPTNTTATRSANVNFEQVYETRRWRLSNNYEYISNGFQMESAFLRRTGISSGRSTLAPNFYPNITNAPWLRRIVPSVTYAYLYDLKSKLWDSDLGFGLSGSFNRSGSASIVVSRSQEGWQGRTFRWTEYSSSGRVQLTKWLNLRGNFGNRGKIFFSAVPAFRGRGWDGGLSVTLQPGSQLTQDFEYSYSDFHHQGEKIFDVHIINSETTFQFNKYFFLRGIVQYNSFQNEMLTDFLSSFTFIPGTVLHVGYSSLYEDRTYIDDRGIDSAKLQNVKRSLFMKASYLWRI